MRRIGLRGWVCLVGLAALVSAESAATDWPQFRGPNRDGVSTEKGLLRSWPDEGPRELWRVPIGEGFSGISVVGDRIYTMYAAEIEGQATEMAAAYDAGTGKELWSVAIGEKHTDTFGNGPRSTPTVDGKTVYVLGSRGDLVALDADKGKELWRVSLTETFEREAPYFGFSTSALVDGNQLIIEGGGPEKSYVGIDTKTGEVRWAQGKTPEDGAGYNSPLRVEVAGGACYVYIVGDHMTCIDKKGSEIWSHPWVGQGETHAMPVFVPPNKIFGAGIEGVGARLFEIQGRGSDVTVEELWKVQHMKNHFSSSVFHDDHIYGFDNATLRAISVKDGASVWAKRGLGKGSLIFADGRLLVLSDKGALVLVQATADGYNESGRVQALEGRCWTAPTLSNGKLYLRNHEEMVSYDLER